MSPTIDFACGNRLVEMWVDANFHGGLEMDFGLEWILGLNGSWAWIVDFRRHFRVLLHSEITYFLIIGLSLRASNRGCLQMPPWFFEKPQTCIQIFQKINLQPDTHPQQQHTHTDAHTWFLPSTGDICSSTGLRWGITLDNCSTGKIFGNSTKPDTYTTTTDSTRE